MRAEEKRLVHETLRAAHPLRRIRVVDVHLRQALVRHVRVHHLVRHPRSSARFFSRRRTAFAHVIRTRFRRISIASQFPFPASAAALAVTQSPCPLHTSRRVGS